MFFRSSVAPKEMPTLERERRVTRGTAETEGGAKMKGKHPDGA
jgi:hypothetical protein